MTTVLGNLLRIDREKRSGHQQAALVTRTNLIHLRPTSECPLPATVLLSMAGTEPHLLVERHLSGWVAWQNKFNEKERTEKRQFAVDFKQKLQSKQMEIQNLINGCDHEL